MIMSEFTGRAFASPLFNPAPMSVHREDARDIVRCESREVIPRTIRAEREVRLAIDLINGMKDRRYWSPNRLSLFLPSFLTFFRGRQVTG